MDNSSTTYIIGGAPSAGFPAGVGVVSSGAAMAAEAVVERDDEQQGAAIGIRSPERRPPDDDPLGRSQCVVLFV